MAFVIPFRRVNGKADDASRRRPALAILARLAARLEPRVGALLRVSLPELSAVRERIRVEHPRRVLALLDCRKVGLRVPHAAVVGLGVVQVLVPEEPGHSAGLLDVAVVVVDVVCTVLEASVVVLRKDVADIEARVGHWHGARGQRDGVADVVGIARVALAVREQSDGEIAMPEKFHIVRYP